MKSDYYRAPWSLALHFVSWFALAVCLAVSVGGAAARQPWPHYLSVLPIAVPLALIVGCALFTVRGYRVTENTLLVRRLFWSTPIPLAGLRSATPDPQAMRASLRTFGNGGFFSFSGFYWNSRLRTFRAYVTSPKQCVILRFEKRVVVVSPDQPEKFAREVMAQAQTPNQAPPQTAPAPH